MSFASLLFAEKKTNPSRLARSQFPANERIIKVLRVLLGVPLLADLAKENKNKTALLFRGQLAKEMTTIVLIRAKTVTPAT